MTMPRRSTDGTKVWALVPAAGTGQRMQASVAKQYLEINGRVIIEITAGLLLANQSIDQVIVCIAADDQIWPTLKLAAHSNICRVTGGTTRAQSVLNGLQSLQGRAQDDDWVLVHDAARPCLSAPKLDDFIHQVSASAVGGIMAIRATDTIKLARSQTDTTAVIQQTLDRSLIWQAQTPQMFPYGLLLNAITQALIAGAQITDESSAMVWAGHSPCLIEGESSNLKITRQDDLPMAQHFLKTANAGRNK
jgi:2-C-methyl-D-erythritol 4-phosphate cytidylyltransferase